MRLLILLLALMLAGCTGPEKADWTLLFYVAADNDLEDAQVTDLLEVLAAPDSPRVHRCALVDRSPRGPQEEGYSAWRIPGLGDWEGARWLTLAQGQAHLLEDWGAQNLAQEAVLERFLSASRRRFPAHRYALVLADHGEAWRGACSDDGAEDPEDLLTPAEISQALSRSGFQADQPLDLLAFDACLMATLEVAAALAPNVRYLVASEDSVAWGGLAYREPLERLAREPEMPARELGEAVLEAYARGLATPGDPQAARRATLSLLDLTRVDPVLQATEALAQALIRELGRPGRWLELARLREATQEFARSEESLEPDSHQVDLDDLARRLAPLPGLAGPCASLREHLRALVLKNYARRAWRATGGLSIYFPSELSPPARRYAFGDSWARLVRRYLECASQDRSRPRLGELAREGQGYPLTLRCRLGDAAAVERSWLVLVREDWIIGRQPSWPEEDDPYLREVFDGRWLTLGPAGQPGLPAPVARVEDLDEQRALAYLGAQWRRAGGDWQEVTLVMALDFSKPDWEGGLVSLRRRGEVLEPQAGDRLRLTQESLRGRPPRPGPELTLAEPGGLTLALRPVPAGHYELGFLVVTYAGGRAWRTTPIELE